MPMTHAPIQYGGMFDGFVTGWNMWLPGRLRLLGPRAGHGSWLGVPALIYYAFSPGRQARHSDGPGSACQAILKLPRCMP